MVSTAVSHKPLHQDPVLKAGPSLTGRAVLALAFLVGFYALALGAVAALVGANVALYAMAGRMQAQLVIVTVFVAGAVLRGMCSSSPAPTPPTCRVSRSTSTASRSW